LMIVSDARSNEGLASVWHIPQCQRGASSSMSAMGGKRTFRPTVSLCVLAPGEKKQADFGPRGAFLERCAEAPPRRLSAVVANQAKTCS
jgi:hypothetical protein